MKKVLLLLIFLLSITFSASAEISKYKIYSYAVKQPGENWTKWTKIDFDVTIDSVKKRIVIDSPTPQILDFVGFEEKETANSIILTSYGTDTYYRSVYIHISIHSASEIYLSIAYDNLIMMHKMRSIE